MKDDTRSTVLAIDGSAAPGMPGGGWAVVRMDAGILTQIRSGFIPHCINSMEAEVTALLEAVQYMPEDRQVTIVCDCRTLVQVVLGKSDGRKMPRCKDVMNTMEALRSSCVLQWRPSNSTNAQRLAHHLANAARIESLMHARPNAPRSNRRRPMVSRSRRPEEAEVEYA